MGFSTTKARRRKGAVRGAVIILPVALLAAACVPKTDPAPAPQPAPSVDAAVKPAPKKPSTTVTTVPSGSSASPSTTAPPTTAPPTTAPPTTAPPTTAPPTTAPPTTAPPTTAPPTTVPPTTAPPTTTTTIPAAGSRDAKLWPFASTSPWNTPIGSGATFASATADPRYADLTDAYVAINAQTWSMATYVASASDPMRTVTSHAGTWQYRIPDNAVAAGPADGDRHLLVIDPAGQYVDECWLASKQSNGNWWCEYHVRNDLRGAGVLEAGVRAYGGSALGGLIRTWELNQGSIKHALALAVPRRDMAHGPVWPANSEDGGATYGGSLPMGSLVSIPRTVNLAGLNLSPGGLVLAKTLRDYGAYLVDASENFTLFAEPSAESKLAGARGDLEKIREQLRVVTNNSPSTPGGGGTPITTAAPGFSG